jgi:hypothetical protein
MAGHNPGSQSGPGTPLEISSQDKARYIIRRRDKNVILVMNNLSTMGNTSDSSSAGGYTGRRHADYWKLPWARNRIDEVSGPQWVPG